VWVILFSYPVVGEQPSTTQIVAACFIIIGEVIVAIFGDHTNDDAVTVEDVVRAALI
jgi:drug/metabolite transporter (DMT)-like permease